jgi:hypothetical protein
VFVNPDAHTVSTSPSYRHSSMLYTALAVAFVLVAVVVGASNRAAARPWIAATLAAAIVAAQFALLMST